MRSMRRGTPRLWRRWLAVAGTAVTALAVTSLVATPAQATTSQTPIAGGGQHAPFMGTTAAAKSGTAAATSPNWAGFATTGTPVTSVAGAWTQPSVVCPGKKLEQSAFWVGIDGYLKSDSNVEQVGTDSDCTKGTKRVPSHAVYYAWLEMVPAALVPLDPTTFPVVPGDALSAGVSVVGSIYTLSISDATQHWSYSTPELAATPLPLNSSAEWIAEAPCSGSSCKVLPLADFGSVTFTGATVNGGPVNAAGLTDDLITMAKNKKASPKASTSSLDGTGHSFTVTWLTN